MINFEPDRLPYEVIRDIVEDFRKKHNHSQRIPIDIEQVIEFNLKLEIRPIRELKSRTGIEAFLSNDLKAIWVDYSEYFSKYTNRRLQFTLAEEVGHFILHRKIYEQGVKYESQGEFIKDVLEMGADKTLWIDRQAREFAGRLLVPRDELFRFIENHEKQIKEFHDKNTSEEDCVGLVIEAFSRKICGEFGVSWEVIKARIRAEGFKSSFIKEE